jgi:hypothetical protein
VRGFGQKLGIFLTKKCCYVLIWEVLGRLISFYLEQVYAPVVWLILGL